VVSLGQTRIRTDGRLLQEGLGKCCYATKTSEVVALSFENCVLEDGTSLSAVQKLRVRPANGSYWQVCKECYLAKALKVNAV
jgi:hypothetical protein